MSEILSGYVPDLDPSRPPTVSRPNETAHRWSDAASHGADVAEQLDARPPEPGAGLLSSLGELSIRVARPTGRRACALCRRPLVAAGPIGHAGASPICDRCLLDHDSQLGMVMALVSVVRAYGSGRPRSAADEEQARVELLAFARVYDRFAVRHGPARPPFDSWPIDG